MFYTSQTSGEVTHLARAGLTNFPALPDLKQVASQSVAPDDSLRGALATAMGLDTTATDDDIVAGLLDRQRPTPATTAPKLLTGAPENTLDAGSIPIEAVAEFIANQGKADLEKTAAAAVDNAMKAGRLPPALQAWGTDLCKKDPNAFQACLAASPFNLSGDLGLSGAPPGKDAGTSGPRARSP